MRYPALHNGLMGARERVQRAMDKHKENYEKEIFELGEELAAIDAMLERLKPLFNKAVEKKIKESPEQEELPKFLENVK